MSNYKWNKSKNISIDISIYQCQSIYLNMINIYVKLNRISNTLKFMYTNIILI